MILVGPGSLYTSILPNLLVPDIAAAIRASQAFKVYICNVATQPGETEHFSCGDHVQALTDHIGRGLFDLIVHNNRFDGELLENMHWVKVGDEDNIGYPTYMTDLVADEEPWHHDSQKLASVLMDLYLARTGPLAAE
jgi:uncharacterized cofD-like protein